MFGLFVFEYSNTEKDRESGINGGKGGTGVKASDEYIAARGEIGKIPKKLENRAEI